MKTVTVSNVAKTKSAPTPIVRIVAGRDLAVTHNYERGANRQIGGESRTVSIRATNLFRKEGGAWKMIGHHVDKLPYLVEPN